MRLFHTRSSSKSNVTLVSDVGKGRWTSTSSSSSSGCWMADGKFLKIESRERSAGSMQNSRPTVMESKRAFDGEFECVSLSYLLWSEWRREWLDFDCSHSQSTDRFVRPDLETQRLWKRCENERRSTHGEFGEESWMRTGPRSWQDVG